MTYTPSGCRAVHSPIGRLRGEQPSAKIAPWRLTETGRLARQTLTAPNARRSFPPNNRVPQGINIVQAYALAATRSIAFKTGAGGNGEITDPSRIRAFVDALDTTFPTTQAVLPPPSVPTTYYLHFDIGTRVLSIEYDARDGTLTVAADGFAVRPGQSFAALVADIR